MGLAGKEGLGTELLEVWEGGLQVPEASSSRGSSINKEPPPRRPSP